MRYRFSPLVNEPPRREFLLSRGLGGSEAVGLLAGVLLADGLAAFIWCWSCCCCCCWSCKCCCLWLLSCRATINDFSCGLSGMYLGGVREWLWWYEDGWWCCCAEDSVESDLMCTGLEHVFELVDWFDSLLSESRDDFTPLVDGCCGAGEYLRALGNIERLKDVDSGEEDDGPVGFVDFTVLLLLLLGLGLSSRRW